MAYIQMCHIDNRHNKDGTNTKHKVFGRLTGVAFLLHTVGALSLLYEDVEGHSPLNKLILASSLMGTSYKFIVAMCHAIKGKINEHRLWMTNAYLSSLDGAGTIRTVAAIQMLFGYGPIACQIEYGQVGDNCDWTYTWRLLWVTVLRQCLWFIFANYESKRLAAEAVHVLRAYYMPLYAVLIGCFMFGYDQMQSFYVVVLATMAWMCMLMMKNQPQQEIAIQKAKNPGDANANASSNADNGASTSNGRRAQMEMEMEMDFDAMVRG